MLLENKRHMKLEQRNVRKLTVQQGAAHDARVRGVFRAIPLRFLVVANGTIVTARV